MISHSWNSVFNANHQNFLTETHKVDYNCANCTKLWQYEYQMTLLCMHNVFIAHLKFSGMKIRLTIQFVYRKWPRLVCLETKCKIRYNWLELLNWKVYHALLLCPGLPSVTKTTFATCNHMIPLFALAHGLYPLLPSLKTLIVSVFFWSIFSIANIS